MYKCTSDVQESNQRPLLVSIQSMLNRMSCSHSQQELHWLSFEGFSLNNRDQAVVIGWPLDVFQGVISEQVTQPPLDALRREFCIPAVKLLQGRHGTQMPQPCASLTSDPGNQSFQSPTSAMDSMLLHQLYTPQNKACSQNLDIIFPHHLVMLNRAWAWLPNCSRQKSNPGWMAQLPLIAPTSL